MTTFTDKELIKEIKERIGSLDVRDNIERRAYEIALASLEAEPVAECIVEDGGMCIDGFGEYVGHSLPDGTHELYAAPPAPVVPEAAPVAWTDEEELRDVKQYGLGEIFQYPPDKYADSRRVIPLYRVPPAPEVPEEMYWQDAPVEGSSKAAAYATGWNACRAVMLRNENI
ncbi:hypothetical protein OSK68_24325 [Escherichia coli]|nr:hypothetical protein [Escherichia coli]